MVPFEKQKALRENLIVKCPNCGATFRGGRGRCPACGYRVEVKKLVRRCPVCKARVAEGAKTCLMCGASLEGGRGFVPRISLSMVPPAPLMGAALAIAFLVAIWFIKPWRVIHIGTYDTPTPTLTATSTPTLTPTASPTPTSPPTSTATPEVTTYAVRSGDTLSLIAARFGVAVEAIMEANGLSDHMIRVGQELVIPLQTEGPNPEPVETPAVESTPQRELTTYVVQEGDSLSEIAERLHVSVQSIMQANDITNPDSIRQGQKLVIPSSPGSTETPGIGGPPTPTISSHFVYPAPVLLAPPDGYEFHDDQAELPILLNWLSVGLLGEDEWYLVTVRHVLPEEGEGKEIVELTKANSSHLSTELRPPRDTESHLFEWGVRVVRVVESEVGGDPEVVPIGRSNATRTFYWY